MPRTGQGAHIIRITTIATLTLLAATAASADEARLIEEARQVATAVPPKLLAVLTQEIQSAGPAGAIDVCKEKAPKMAAEASAKTGWQIRRVSLKNRNPKAAPDAWEEAVLKDFDRRAAAGENPAGLEKGETVTMDGKPVNRYMRALPTQELCLNCHGSAEQIQPDTAAKLKALYPADKATGFSVGQIRGAMTIRRAL